MNLIKSKFRITKVKGLMIKLLLNYYYHYNKIIKARELFIFNLNFD